MVRLLTALAPPRLGPGFRWLLGSSWAANLGDGLRLAAGPLLMASVTTDPLLIAAAALAQWLPALLFGLLAGVLADRADRRRLLIGANLVRVAVLAALVGCVLTDRVGATVVLAAVFLLGTAETVVDTAGGALLPTLLAPRDLGIGNARLGVGAIVGNKLAGPPIGAALFAAGAAWPFLAQALLLAAGAALASRIVLPAPERPAAGPARRVGTDIRDGVRWLWAHPPMRTLALTILAFNVTFGAAWSVLVLYSAQRLGLGAVGFGLITTAGAVGGLLAAAAYGRLERRFGVAALMRCGLVVEALTHLALAVTTVPWVALAVFAVFGAHESVWGTTSSSVRQRAVPLAYQGRVSGVYRMGMTGGLVIGSGLGGILAKMGGVTGPFWFAFAGSALLLVLIWRELGQIAHASPADSTLEERP